MPPKKKGEKGMTDELSKLGMPSRWGEELKIPQGENTKVITFLPPPPGKALFNRRRKNKLKERMNGLGVLSSSRVGHRILFR